MFYWFLKTVLLGPLLRLVFRPYVEGLENVPEEGPAILASNHLSFSDSIFLPLVLPRRVTFLAKSEYFTGRGVKGRLTAGFFRGAGQLPVDRSGGRASEAALRTGLKVLNSGHLLGLYPEGTRSPDGRLYRGKTGVARMALEARVPVIPVVMVDTEKVQPPGKLIPKVMRVGVRIGKPLDFSRYDGMAGDRFVLRAATDELMYELMTLSGQEYVDVYAASLKERGKRLPGGRSHRGDTDGADAARADSARIGPAGIDPARIDPTQLPPGMNPAEIDAAELAAAGIDGPAAPAAGQDGEGARARGDGGAGPAAAGPHGGEDGGSGGAGGHPPVGRPAA